MLITYSLFNTILYIHSGALTKSLYCAIANMDVSPAPAIAAPQNVLSNTCELIAKSHFTTNHYTTVVYPPSTYCDQAPIPGKIPYLQHA